MLTTTENRRCINTQVRRQLNAFNFEFEAGCGAFNSPTSILVAAK